jgi:N-acetylglucosamine malate deacetylase 1
MKTVLAIAPHPDDETLGCGGTLLRHRAEGDAVHWLTVTELRPEAGYAAERIAARRLEIEAVARHYGFASAQSLALPTTRLDTLPKGDVIARMGEAFRRIRPEIVYLPFPGDAHSDHAAVFEAAAACCKWFRYPTVKRVLAYETLSETGFNLDPGAGAFRPNVYVDVSAHLEGKLAAMELYAGESGDFPFPRSRRAMQAQADLRGSESGFRAAEAFLLLRESL